MADKVVITIEVHAENQVITLSPDNPDSRAGKLAYKIIEKLQEKPRTNGDRIRNMSNAELADFICQFDCPPDNLPDVPCDKCNKCWINWLNKEVLYD